MAIRVIQVGLGPIGRQVTRYLLEREEIELVAAFDSDPDKHGRDVGELDGAKPLGVRVSEWDSAPGNLQADVAVLSTVSQLELAAPQLVEIASRGLHVVSTCEELVHPWRTSPEGGEHRVGL